MFKLHTILLKQSRVEPVIRIEALSGATIVWLQLGLLLAKGKVLDLIRGDGDDRRYSNSKFQVVTWFSVVIVTYSATVVLRWLRLGADLMWVNIPTHLLMLSGLSAFTFGAAKGITTSKIESAKAAGNENAKSTKSSGLVQDLTTNDQDKLDLGDFQMLVITLVTVCLVRRDCVYCIGSTESRCWLITQRRRLDNIGVFWTWSGGVPDQESRR